MGPPQSVEILGLARGELLGKVVCDAGQVVYPYVCSAPNIPSANLDVVGVDQEDQISELAHHGGGLRGEMRGDVDEDLLSS